MGDETDNTKAYFVTIIGGEGGVFLHAKNRNQARYHGYLITGDLHGLPAYCDFAAYRVRELDGKLFTYQNLCECYGKEQVDEWGYKPERQYRADYCRCNLCIENHLLPLPQESAGVGH